MLFIKAVIRPVIVYYPYYICQELRKDGLNSDS